MGSYDVSGEFSDTGNLEGGIGKFEFKLKLERGTGKGNRKTGKRKLKLEPETLELKPEAVELEL